LIPTAHSLLLLVLDLAAEVSSLVGPMTSGGGGGGGGGGVLPVMRRCLLPHVQPMMLVPLTWLT
jgi:hypothetical protein